MVHSSCTLMSFNKYIIKCIYQCIIINNNFSGLKILCSIYSSFSLKPLTNTDLFTVSIVLPNIKKSVEV